MSELLERVKLSNIVNGNNIIDVFKKNSLFLFESLKTSNDDIKALSIKDIKIGGFYFIHYNDKSDWMKYSPIFVVDFKQFNSLNILLAVNFNFIPLEIRVSIFDKYIKESDFDKDNYLKVNYQGMYSELIRYGFEYALVEYNILSILLCHKISLDILPRFLYSCHPIIKYDPGKLYSIWLSKIKTRDKRNNDISKTLISDIYNLSNDINENYNQLKEHIKKIK